MPDRKDSPYVKNILKIEYKTIFFIIFYSNFFSFFDQHRIAKFMKVYEHFFIYVLKTCTYTEERKHVRQSF